MSKIINSGEIYDDGFLRIEHRHFYIACQGELIKLARAEFLIVSKLVQNVDRLVMSKDLWNHIWKGQRPFNQESLKVCIHMLRRKLKPHGIKIETKVSVGYKIVSERSKN